LLPAEIKNVTTSMNSHEAMFTDTTW